MILCEICVLGDFMWYMVWCYFIIWFIELCFIWMNIVLLFVEIIGEIEIGRNSIYFGLRGIK
jgi:hypothetical protein